jgi:predicted P-loop ATPase/GTPase
MKKLMLIGGLIAFMSGCATSQHQAAMVSNSAGQEGPGLAAKEQKAQQAAWKKTLGYEKQLKKFKKKADKVRLLKSLALAGGTISVSYDALIVNDFNKYLIKVDEAAQKAGYNLFDELNTRLSKSALLGMQNIALLKPLETDRTQEILSALAGSKKSVNASVRAAGNFPAMIVDGYGDYFFETIAFLESDFFRR